MNEQLPPPALGSEPVSTHVPEGLASDKDHTRKSNLEIEAQIVRISDKLIARAAKANSSADEYVGRQVYVDIDNKRGESRLSVYGTDENDPVQSIKREGGYKTEIKEQTYRSGEPYLATFVDVKAQVQVSPDGLRGRVKGNPDLKPTEIISESARILGNIRGAIARQEQASKEEK